MQTSSERSFLFCTWIHNWCKKTMKDLKTAAVFAKFKVNFQRCKVLEGLHTWEIIISNNKMKICSLSLRKTAILTRFWWEECLVNEFVINIKNANNPRRHLNCNFRLHYCQNLWTQLCESKKICTQLNTEFCTDDNIPSSLNSILKIHTSEKE